MEGSVLMTKRMSSDQQIVSITQYMKQKLDRFDELSEEERRKEARKVMMTTGLFDDDYNFIAPIAGENLV